MTALADYCRRRRLPDTDPILPLTADQCRSHKHEFGERETTAELDVDRWRSGVDAEAPS